MEVRQLRWFIAVAEAGSLSAAAREGHISQPALSVIIAQLERDLGARLLDRGRDGVKLTAAGSAVIGIARRMIDDAELAGIAARAARDTQQEVRLAITDPGIVPLVAGAVAGAMLAGVRVRLVVGQHRPWELHGVKRREVDLSVVTGPVLDPRVRTTPLATDARGILVGPRNELFDADPDDVTFHMLASHAAIDPIDVPPDWTDVWAYRPQMNGERLRRAGPPVDSMSATFLSALTTEAVAFVPRQIGVIGEAMGLRYLEPPAGPRCEHLVAWRDSLSDAARLVLTAATGATH
jgi:DNA-binding transcriptional LysR family regulator